MRAPSSLSPLLLRALSSIASPHIQESTVTTPNTIADCINLEEIDTDLYRSISLWRPLGARGVFGGQVVGQALIAAHASRSDSSFGIHSFHSYFLAAGDASTPILYHVKRLRDGKSFQSRQVTASQRGNIIFHGMASFHVSEPSELEHQYEMPKAPPPDDLPSLVDIQRELIKSDKLSSHMKTLMEKHLDSGSSGFPIDLRYCDRSRIDVELEKPRPPKQMVWMRTMAKIGDDEHLHRCIAAYASDWSLCTTALLPAGLSLMSPKLKMLTSLDHALWVHAKFRFDEWMLYEMESPRCGQGRGVNFGRLFTKDGLLAMTVAQEALVRLH